MISAYHTRRVMSRVEGYFCHLPVYRFTVLNFLATINTRITFFETTSLNFLHKRCWKQPSFSSPVKSSLAPAIIPPLDQADHVSMLKINFIF